MPPNRYHRVKQRKASDSVVSVREAALDFLACAEQEHVL